MVYDNKWNIDKLLIILLPLILLISIFAVDINNLWRYSCLTLAIILYCIIVYEDRYIYGFSGLRILSAPSLVVLSFTLFIAIPSLYIITIVNDKSETAYFVSILLFYALFPMGLYFGKTLYNYNKTKTLHLLHNTIDKTKYDSIFYDGVLLILSISILIFITYILRSKEFPLFELLKDPGDSSKYWILREEALKTLEITRIERYLFHWLRSILLPFLVVTTLYFAIEYDRRKYKYLFVITLVISIIINGITLEKSPIASLFMAIAAYLFLRMNRVKIISVITLVIVILIGPVVISYLILSDRDNVFEVLYWTYIYRLFITPSEVLFYYFKHFPETHPFLLGRSTQLFSWLFPEGTFPISNYIFKLRWDLNTSSGFANANYLGNFWADFGWPGTIISTYILGIIMHIFDVKKLRVSNYKKNIIYISTAAIYTPIFTFGFFNSNFTILFFTKGLIIVFIVLHILEKCLSNHRVFSIT